jgi:hypothetical protein
MANASCSTCTLVSNVLTVAGAVSGTILVGMTITAASVPAGVTIASLGTGSGGIGTYNCSSSGANIPTAEPMVFSLSWDMPLVSNASSPQLLDLARAAGFGMIFATAIQGGSAGPGAQYEHGTHAQAIHAQNTLSTQVFKAAAPPFQGKSIAPMILTQPQYPEPRAPLVIQSAALEPLGMFGAQYQFGLHQKAIYDSQIQAQIWAPTVREGAAGGGFFASEFQFGTHQKALIDSQIQAQFFKPMPRPLVSADLVPLRAFHVPGQDLFTDLTIQGWVKTVPVAQGFLVTMVTAGPQFADFTQQANLAPTQPFHSLAPALPINPTFFFAQPQFDTTQIPARIIKPPATVAKFQPIKQVFAAPDRQDYTQPQGQVLYTSLPGPAKYIQPAFIAVSEQQYDKTIFPQLVFQPFIYVPPPPFTGFYVQAVSAGYYGGRFRTPGDIFLLASSADFSDSSVDYQPASSNTVGYGWMAKVTTQQLFDWLQSNNAPYLPPQDPNRRFIY